MKVTRIVQHITVDKIVIDFGKDKIQISNGNEKEIELANKIINEVQISEVQSQVNAK